MPRTDATRTRRVLDALDEGILVRDARGTIVDWNAAALRVMHLSVSQLLGCKKRPTGWKIVPDDGPQFDAENDPVQAALARAAEQGRIVVRVLGADRAAVWITIAAHAENEGDDEITFTLVDITAQREAERENAHYREIIDALDASHRILEESPVAICSVDIDGAILRSNIAFMGLAGIETNSIFALIPPQDHEALREAFAWLLEGRMPSVRRETRLARPSGEPAWCEITAVAMRRGPSDAAILLLVNDITERHEREARLRELAARDPLTGVHNRRSFVHVLTERLRGLRTRGRRAATDYALLLIDLDGFKDVNDTCGHAGGDAVLVAVATAIRERTRAADTVGRLGGDEFAALLELRDATSAGTIAQEIIDRIGGAADAVEGAPRIGASIGIVHLDPQCNAEQTLARADRAMYAAKHAGKARFVEAGPIAS